MIIKVDIWSVGCVYYELLTGDVLFDPRKSRGISTDRQHIYDIQSLLGKIPDEILSIASRRSVFFRKNGLMKGRRRISYTPLNNVLLNKLKKEECEKALKFLYFCFNYKFTSRLSSLSLLNGSLFKDTLDDHPVLHKLN